MLFLKTQPGIAHVLINNMIIIMETSGSDDDLRQIVERYHEKGITDFWEVLTNQNNHTIPEGMIKIRKLQPRFSDGRIDALLRNSEPEEAPLPIQALFAEFA